MAPATRCSRSCRADRSQCSRETAHLAGRANRRRLRPPPAWRPFKSAPNRGPPQSSQPAAKPMQQSDFAFANDIRAAVELRTPKTARMLLAGTGSLMVITLIWAHFAVLDEVKRGNGRVIPARQIQIIQSLEGGIIEQILVHEGTVVQEGQT